MKVPWGIKFFTMFHQTNNSGDSIRGSFGDCVEVVPALLDRRATIEATGGRGGPLCGSPGRSANLLRWSREDVTGAQITRVATRTNWRPAAVADFRFCQRI